MNSAFEFSTVCTKLAEMAILYSKDLTNCSRASIIVSLVQLTQVCNTADVKKICNSL